LKRIIIYNEIISIKIKKKKIYNEIISIKIKKKKKIKEKLKINIAKYLSKTFILLKQHKSYQKEIAIPA